MTPQEFFYYFELTNTEFTGEALVAPQVLTVSQGVCSINHANLALHDDPSAPGVVKVRTMAEMLVAGLNASTITTSIRGAVNDVFEHVIDPKAGGPEVQDKLNKIHHGLDDRPMRC